MKKPEGFEGLKENKVEALLKEANQLDTTEIMAKLEHLSAAEKQKFIERVTQLCLEKNMDKSPSAKKKCAELLHAFSNLRTAKADNDVVIGEYPFNAEGLHLVLRGLVEQPQHSLHEVSWLGMVDDDFAYDRINHDQSLSYLIKISDNPGAMPRNVDLNLKLFKLLMNSGETKKILYIIDRFLTAPVRGQGLGRELLKIVDKIARANDCALSYGILIPEKDEDEKRLIASHKKAGYKIFEKDDAAPIVVKNYK